MSNQITTALSVATSPSAAERIRVEKAPTEALPPVPEQSEVPEAAKDGKDQPDRLPTSAEFAATAQRLNDVATELNRDLEFSVDDSSGRTVIKVINSESGEVVRQIPSEEVLRVARSVENGQVQLIEGLA